MAVAIGLMAAAKARRSSRAVPFAAEVERGAIVIRTAERRLYYVLGMARRSANRVAVGKPANSGSAALKYIDGKYVRPAWAPPREVRRDKPWLPLRHSGRRTGKPMGVAAMTMGPGEDYAIHGTNRPIPSAASRAMAVSACITATSLNFYQRVPVGARVIVMR